MPSFICFKNIGRYSIGYQLTDKFSVGMGVDLILSLWRGDVKKDYIAPNPSLNYDYDAQIRKWGYGFQGNFGMLYKFNEQWSVGATYRTGTDIKLKGDTRVSLKGGSAIDPFKTDEKSDGHTDFVYGASWGIGYFPIQKEEKISPKRSSGVIFPVISDKACCAKRKSSANISPA